MKYRIKEGVVWEEINEKITVLDPEQGKYFILNKTAVEIWKGLKKGQTDKRLMEIFLHKYKNDSKGVKVIEKDLRECLLNLLELGLIDKI